MSFVMVVQLFLALISISHGTSALRDCNDVIYTCLKKGGFPNGRPRAENEITSKYLDEVCRFDILEVTCASSPCDDIYGRKSEIERDANIRRSFCSKLSDLKTLVPCLNNGLLREKYFEIARKTRMTLLKQDDPVERCTLFKRFIRDGFQILKKYCNKTGVQAAVEHFKVMLDEKEHRKMFELHDKAITDDCAEEVKGIVNTFKYK